MEYCQANAERIRQLLKERNITSYKLAELSAVPHSTISMVLSCKTENPRILTLLNLCRGFNITLAEYFNSNLFTLENLSDDD